MVAHNEKFSRGKTPSIRESNIPGRPEEGLMSSKSSSSISTSESLRIWHSHCVMLILEQPSVTSVGTLTPGLASQSVICDRNGENTNLEGADLTGGVLLGWNSQSSGLGESLGMFTIIWNIKIQINSAIWEHVQKE